MFDRFLDFLFPRYSLTGREGEWITEAELRSLRSAPVIVEEARLRAEGLLFLDRIVAAADYDSVPLLKKAVQTLKYRKVRGVGETLGMLLSDASEFSLPSPLHQSLRSGAGHVPAPILCPVPLHWIRKFARGFNQSEILARVVSTRRGWPVQHILRRIRWTGSQVGRRRRDRLTGVRDAFALRPMAALPGRVVLVDDLSTTGATLDTCARVLKEAGVARVEGLVLAMG